MIQLKPKIDYDFTCPECGSRFPEVGEVAIQPMHVMADCNCLSCGFRFYQVFPVGHNVEDPIAFSKTDGRFYGADHAESWLFDALAKARGEIRLQDVKIERVVLKDCRNVVILNTLDYLYGHVLLKLYNALYHLDHQPNLGLILIIPKMFRWLVPDGCAEVWVVDLKLNDLAFHHEAIQSFVSRQFNRFSTIYISRAYSHPDFARCDVSRLTRIKPFDLETFSVRKPVITFILREDRWWFSSIADYAFYRICRKLQVLPWASRVLSVRQQRLVRRTIKKIREQLQEADFFVAGIGRRGGFDHHATDERVAAVDDAVEAAWCRIYAMSHVVVGVHGSNMLLPTALAAGCVEILPEERYGNMVQDISVRHNDRRQLFLYRFADQYSSPRCVASKVVSMIRHYDRFYRNMCRNLYPD